MSDAEMRKGYRAIISGGLSVMGDDEIVNLIKAGNEALKDRNPNMLLAADAEYLQKYVTISESFINSGISLRAAGEQLTELNTEYEGRISKVVQKTGVVNPGVYMADRADYETDEEWDNADEYERDGWMPSDVTC